MSDSFGGQPGQEPPAQGQGGQMAAGWYPDPTGQMRWWDGTQWGQYANAAQGAPQAPMVPSAPMGAPAAGAGDPRGSAAMAHYLGGIIGFLTCGSFGWVAPLIMRSGSNAADTFVADQATEATNFNLAVAIVQVVMGIFSFILGFFCIGFLLWIPMGLLWIAQPIFGFIAGSSASKGEWYRYPITIRMIKGPVAI